MLGVWTVQAIEVVTKIPGTGQGGQVPADVLAGDAHAHHLAVEGMQLGQVLEEDALDFLE
ncbi:hypothetical protein D3C86_1868310 [compost metagenome]